MPGQPTPDQAHARARVARAVQRGDKVVAAEARKDLAEANLEASLRKALKRYRSAVGYTPPPPLTVEQKARLALILLDVAETLDMAS